MCKKTIVKKKKRKKYYKWKRYQSDVFTVEIYSLQADVDLLFVFNPFDH